MFKEYSYIVLRRIVRALAEWTIAKYQPGIVAITGSAGKTSTKLAAEIVLRHYRKVRASHGNFNNELGVPLAILGDWKKIEGKGFWLKVIFVSLFRLVFRMPYPEILILEYAVDRPGDMKYLVDMARPQISVVTAIGDIPVHVEFFSGPEALAREKAKIVEALPAHGFAILNYDDEAVFAMGDRTRAHAVTFGFNEGAAMQITNFEVQQKGDIPIGVAFKLNYGGNFVPVRLNGCFNKAQAYAAAAGACVGLLFGLNLVKIAEALAEYQPPSQRGQLVPGIKNAYIIDDSYNASPLSMRAAIETVHSLKAKRKIAVLGDMLEIGIYTPEAHEAIGKMIPKCFDKLVTVGARAKFIAEAATEAGMAKKNILSFDTADEAKLEVQKLIRQKDLILVKASHSIGLDKIIEEIKHA
ncbi:MAG: UDP-N-acetylmuramoyl-tripeptide--D-alanyl-D-alanine ligase [bacterium]|nr:UDP-N-acetylmuramoyl-tripeptide--D-alanyl-D-alanine ligase [bacterium]